MLASLRSQHREMSESEMMDSNDLIKIALESKASGAAILDTSVIQFHEDFRKACEQNVCRKYDTNWMGPPAVGPISELKKRVLRYAQGMLFQTVHTIASNFDMKGMMAAAGIHELVSTSGSGSHACDPSCLRLAKRGHNKNRQRAVRSRRLITQEV
jgi:hypothetical protein